MPGNVVVLLNNPEGRAMIEQICQTNGMILAEFEALLQIEVEKIANKRRRGLWDEFDDILDRIQEEE